MTGWEVGCVVTEESMRYGWCGNDGMGGRNPAHGGPVHLAYHCLRLYTLTQWLCKGSPYVGKTGWVWDMA